MRIAKNRIVASLAMGVAFSLASACSPKGKAAPSCGGSLIDGAAFDPPPPSCALCPAYGTPASRGPVPDALTELSGIAASRAQPGVYYVHNDSGDSPRIFALDAAGAELGQLCLAGAANVDWEDIEMGPCPAGSCIYVGDIGDNHRQRQLYGIYRVAEPRMSSLQGGGSIAFEHFPFTYGDGPHNAEALFVHPGSGRVYVVTKEGDPSPIYEVPLPAPPPPGQSASVVTAVRVGTVSLGKPGALVTGGDVSPCGNAMLVRTYEALFELRSPDGAPAEVESLIMNAPDKVPVADEIQGEAVSYAANGLGYVTGSERAGGARPELMAVDCK